MKRMRRGHQHGFTLIVALVMLVLLTLLALSSFNMVKGDLQVVSNMQQHNETVAAANQTLEEVISSPQFYTSPNDALPNPCNGNPNTRCVDSNGDGTAAITVQLSPAPHCVKAQAIKNSSLDISKSDDVACSVGGNQNFGVAGAVTGDSLCDDSVWEVHAIASDAVSEAKAEATMGISVRVAKDDVATSCP